MLSYIKWIVKNLELNSVIILTDSWVWYELVINELVYSKIFDKNIVELFVYHSISENGQSLFGFLEIEDRIFFKELIKISWVWWRVAQTILSLWIQRLKKAIIEDDKKTLETIKWVWKKMAEKIVLELKDKDFLIWNYEDKQEIKIENRSNIKPDTKNEIITTLTLMWYNWKKVEDLLNNLPLGYDDIWSIIPYVIKNI